MNALLSKSYKARQQEWSGYAFTFSSGLKGLTTSIS